LYFARITKSRLRIGFPSSSYLVPLQDLPQLGYEILFAPDSVECIGQDPSVAKPKVTDQGWFTSDAEDLGQHDGDKSYEQLRPRHIRKWRDGKSETPEAENELVKFLRQVFAHGVRQDMVDSNPAKAVEYISIGSTGFHSWTREEFGKYRSRWPVGTKQRLAMEMLLLFGLRRSDVVVAGPQHVRDGWLKMTLFKGGKKTPTVIEIPVLASLQSVIDATPCGDLSFLATGFGKPYTANGFGNTFKRWCAAAGVPDNCSTHGLRKVGAAIAAKNGATDHQLMAIFGWLTSKEAQRYTRAANRKRMAGEAMGLLEEKAAAETAHTANK